MHFIVGFGVLAGLIWFAFGATAARVVVGAVLILPVLLVLFVIWDPNHLWDANHVTAPPVLAQKQASMSEWEARGIAEACPTCRF
jgi:hypothetical protein